jgi:flagellar biosynthesis protein FlhB
MVMVMAALSEGLIANAVSYLAYSLGRLSQAQSLDGEFGALMVDALSIGASLVWPLLISALALGIVANVAQVGFVFSGEPIKPKFERLNPFEGVKRLFSVRALFDLVKALFKLILIGTAAYMGIRGEIGSLLMAGFSEGAGGLVIAGRVLLSVALRVGVMYLIIGVADFLFQRYEHKKGVMMTKQEVKEEHKQMEGDPQIKARQREIQRMIATRRMFQELPQATVLVTNPTHFAVALKYDADRGGAPVVVAKGCDYLAQRIIQKAREHDVPVVQNPEVARALYSRTELGHEIPVELYRLVAEILAEIFYRERRGL